MTLKNELQQIELDKLTTAYLGHAEKIAGLRENVGTDAVDDELVGRFDTYPGLSAFPIKLVELLISEGIEEDKAVAIATGANLMVNALMDVAEIQELPII